MIATIILWTVLVFIYVGIALFTWAICKAGAMEDERMDRAIKGMDICSDPEDFEYGESQ